DVVRELSVELALEPVAADEPREPPHALLRLKNQLNRFRQAAPVRDLAIEPRASLPREAVDLRGAAGVRFRPRRREQAAVREPVERRIERPLWYLEQRARNLSNALRDRVAMERLARQHFQDEHVERALQEVEIAGVSGHA